MVRALTKRALLAAPSLLLWPIAPSWAQTPSSDATENYSDFFSPELPDLINQGTLPATAPEVQKSLDLISKAPQGRTPLDVMLYFEALTDKNADNEYYNAGWRTRWNPVIVTFFHETSTKPSGDVTPWCAACLNWTMARSEYLGRTLSASSGSFRNIKGKTNNPQKGDVVVFRSADPTKAALGNGHVALYLDQDDTYIFVVGGNQKNDFGHNAICRKRIKKRSNVLIFDSYHSMNDLRAA
jgi:uncharacterized protein (TIGR02594 family)